MKIYDWKTFLGSVIICVGVIAYKIISFTDFFDLLWIALFAYLLFQCLKVFLTKSGFEAEQARKQEAIRLRHKMVEKYGNGINYLIYSPFVVFGVGAIIGIILAYVTPYETLASIIYLATTILFVILIIIGRLLQKKADAE